MFIKKYAKNKTDFKIVLKFYFFPAKVFETSFVKRYIFIYGKVGCKICAILKMTGVELICSCF